VLIQKFGQFEIKERPDPLDKALDFVVTGSVEEGDDLILLKI
jgi:hypothetical protein